MQLTSQQLITARTQPQSCELYLSIFRPRTVMAALVTGTVSTGARQIGYYNVSTGSISSIEPGMTLLVGTTAGGRELGKIRIVSGTSSQFIVAENGHINWGAAQHLTVQRYWEVWPVYPRIIPDPNNDENVIFYKDYDVPYTNQNTNLGAFPLAGPHRGCFVGESLFWSATGTTHLRGLSLTYQWAFEGGTPTGSTAQTPGYVTYPTAGDYVQRLTVVGQNGTRDTTYRYVTVRDPIGSSGNTPIKNWTISDVAGSRGQGGYSSTITITNEPVEVHDGDVVIIWSDTWYGDNNVALGGNSPNNEKVFFVGYVQDGTIKYNHQNSTVEFQVASVTETMKRSEGFSVSVESKQTPDSWNEILDMDGRRALYHYLKWHSTVLSVCDFRFRGNDQKIQFFDSDRESIFDAVDNFMRMTFPGSLTSDRQGMLWAETHPSTYTNPTGSFPPVMELTKDDWANEPTITEQKVVPLSYLEMGGIAYSGSVTGTFTAHIAAAPSQVPNVRGSTERKQGLAIAGQTQLNRLVGHEYAQRIAKYPQITTDLTSAALNLDIAPQEAVKVIVNPSDTPSGISINLPYIITDRSWMYDPLNKTLMSNLTGQILTNGSIGETIVIPDIPPDDGYSGSDGFNFSPGNLPPFLGGFMTIGPAGAWDGAFAGGDTSSVGFVLTNTKFNRNWPNPGFAPELGLYLVVTIFETYDAPVTILMPNFLTSEPSPNSNIECDPNTHYCFTSIVMVTSLNPVPAPAGSDLRPYAQVTSGGGTHNTYMAKIG